MHGKGQCFIHERFFFHAFSHTPPLRNESDNERDVKSEICPTHHTGVISKSSVLDVDLASVVLTVQFSCIILSTGLTTPGEGSTQQSACSLCTPDACSGNGDCIILNDFAAIQCACKMLFIPCWFALNIFLPSLYVPYMLSLVLILPSSAVVPQHGASHHHQHQHHHHHPNFKIRSGYLSRQLMNEIFRL